MYSHFFGMLQYGGSHWVFYLWAYSSLGSIATTILYPQFIAPIFNKFILVSIYLCLNNNNQALVPNLLVPIVNKNPNINMCHVSLQ